MPKFSFDEDELISENSINVLLFKQLLKALNSVPFEIAGSHLCLNFFNHSLIYVVDALQDFLTEFWMLQTCFAFHLSCQFGLLLVIFLSHNILKLTII